jgi:5-methyltetrahydropteroyltriglutamate--homocysteine methyltransferase
MTKPAIRTTHTGSLPRPPELVDRWRRILETGAEGHPEQLEPAIRSAVQSVVARQRETGLDVVNDGEMGKISYVTYVKDRLTGFEGESKPPPLPELRDYPEFARRVDPAYRLATSPACNGPVRLKNPEAVQRDIGHLREAAGDDISGCFMSAASPGVVSVFFRNEFYSTREEYLSALIDALRPEYQAIVDAGFILQLDCPDLGMGRQMQFSRLDDDEFRKEAALNVEALNVAVSGLPADRLRMHVCWGNYEGPHHRDIPLSTIVDIVLSAAPAGIALEASNPRHAHEWAVFENVRLPEGKYLIPGVIDSTSNYIEHPELVAQRLERYINSVGPSRVMAGTDCGFGTFIGASLVEANIAWAKLASLVAGARLVTSGAL